MNAQEVLDRYWDGKLPVNPVVIAQAMGIEVFTQHAISESGRVTFELNQPPRIVFNADEALVRQRFTVAHEIGHLALGHLPPGGRMFRDDAQMFFTSVRDYREVEANQFAANLLMPAETVKTVFYDMPNIDLPAMAALFNVSSAAMRFRLINLGLIRG